MDTKRVHWADTNPVRSYTVSSSTRSSPSGKARRAPLGRVLAPPSAKHMEYIAFATKYALYIEDDAAWEVLRARIPIRNVVELRNACHAIERAAGIDQDPVRQTYYRYGLFWSLYAKEPYTAMFDRLFWTKRFLPFWNKKQTPADVFAEMRGTTKTTNTRPNGTRVLRDASNLPSHTYANKYRATRVSKATR